MVDAKRELRQRMRETLAGLSEEERRRQSQIVVGRLRNMPIFKQISVVYGYAPTATEVDIRPLLEEALQSGKIVALPRIEGRGRMRFYQIDSLADVREGAYGINEPIGTNCISVPGLMLVPGLAFTTDGRRLGHGGGFYDRYLQRHMDLYTVAALFAEQLVDDLPLEDHDEIIDRLVIGGDRI